MLKALSKFLTGAALFTPVILSARLFFPFITGKALVFRSLIEIALLLYVLHVLFLKDRRIEWERILARLKHPLVLSVTIFVLLFVLFSFLALNFNQAFWSNFERSEGAFQLIHYYIFFLLLVSLFPTRKDIEKVLSATIIFSTFAAIYAAFQWLALPAKFGIVGITARVSGTLGNPSYLAVYLIFSIVFILYFLLRDQRLRYKLALAALAIFQFLLLLKTGTKGAILGVGLGIVVFLLVNVLRKNAGKILRISSLLILVVCLSLFFTFLSTFSSDVWTKVPFSERFLNVDEAVKTIQPRLWSWESAVAGFIEKPLRGWGPENYSYVFDKYYNPKHFGHESFFDRVHNLYLENLISGGILLFLSFLAIIFYLFKEIWKKEKNLWFGILLALPFAYLVQAFFLFDVLVTYLCFFTLLALVMNKEAQHQSPAVFRPRQTKVLAFLFLSLILLVNILFLKITLLSLLVLLGIAFLIFFERPEKSYYMASLIDSIIALALILLLALTLFSTIYLPYQKNKALAQTFTVSDILQRLEVFEYALALPSPVGQDETAGALNMLALSLSETLSTNPEIIDLESLRYFMDKNNYYFDLHRDIFPGLRQTYINGSANIRIGIIFGQDDYFQRGKALYEEALKISPSRIEFVVLLMETARAEKDEEEYKRWLSLAKSLRPDVFWPPFNLEN